MIEGDDAVDFGSGEIQCACNQAAAQAKRNRAACTACRIRSTDPADPDGGPTIARISSRSAWLNRFGGAPGLNAGALICEFDGEI
jgi:hypothetical protein